MRTKDLELLRKLPLFDGIDDEGLRPLAASAMFQRYPRDTVLFHQGELPDFLHVLVEGTVCLTGGTEDGREAVIELITPVDGFILAAAITDAPYLMGARVLETAHLLLIPAAALRRQIIGQPAFALTMMASLACQYRRMVRQIKDLKLRTASQRLAAFLLSQAGAREPGSAFTLAVAKQVLAGRLGMTPENLSRAFTALAAHGVVVHARQVTLERPQALEAFCHADALIDDDERDLRVLVD